MISATPKPVVRGERFGSLVACLPSSRTNQGRMWLCKCDCGTWCERLGGSLRYAQRNGSESACGTCNREMRGGAWHVHREYFLGALKGLWEDHHTLWSINSEARLTNDTWRDLLDEFGPVAEEQSVTTTTDELQPRAFTSSRGSGSDISLLYPLNGGEDREWVCSDCGAKDFEGFGCVGCVEFVCIECVRDGKHKYHDPDGNTLLEVGESFEETRSGERVRQIETRALRKMREKLYCLLENDQYRARIDAAIRYALNAREIADAEARARAEEKAAVAAARKAADAELQRFLDAHPFHHGAVAV